MKSNRILDAVGAINEEAVLDAKAYKKPKTRSWVKWGVAAACFFFVALAGFFAFHSKEESPTVILGGITRHYKDISVVRSESSIIYPWEYLTLSEQYGTMSFAGREYTSKGRAVDTSLLGEQLGSGEATGSDPYTNQEYHMTVDVRQINGISENLMVAVKLGEEFIVFNYNEYEPPATFGEVLDNYSLAQVLTFDRFSVYDGHTVKEFYSLESDDTIWEILSSCRDAAFIEDNTWSQSERNSISFTATSDSLGVYKRVFNVTDDGYISTNIFDWAYIFDIGEDAASKIITYATENGVETESEPYTNTLAGTLVEIGNGYILVDDSILCSDQSDGMVFKILTGDLRISRVIDFEKIGVGDTVMVSFTGDIHVDADNLVSGAYSMSKADISDGNVMVPE